MINESDLNIIVSNVVSENRYMHCRLCLGDIKQEYVRFEDCVSVGDSNTDFTTLSGVLNALLGAEICDIIPGIDAVCTDCANKTLQCFKFLEKCKNSTKLLHKIIDNLTETLNTEIEITKEHQMYVIVNENESKVVLLDHEARQLKQHQFVCEECNEVFETTAELKVHNVSCHGTMTCEQCLQTFPNNSELEAHEISGHKFKCSNCHQYKSTGESLKEHKEKAHTMYMCKDCGKSCKGLDRLRAHEEKHITKSECPKCGKTYITKDFFTKHVKLCLEDRIEPHPFRGKFEKTFFCEKCGKGYSTSGGLRVHDRFVHGNAKPHICEYCGKKFTAPSYLKIHMVKHTGEKNFKCIICGNNFVSKEALLYHTRRHTGEKPYSCKLCNERFVNASARAEHIKFKHAGPKLTCDICSRKFFTSTFLRQHISRHHDPSSKLYSGRSMIPPNMPGEQNMRYAIENEHWN